MISKAPRIIMLAGGRGRSTVSRNEIDGRGGGGGRVLEKTTTGTEEKAQGAEEEEKDCCGEVS